MIKEEKGSKGLAIETSTPFLPGAVDTPVV